MTALHGVVTASGAAVRVGAVVLPLPNTAQSVREWAAGLNLCPECHSPVCDCITPEEMTALLERLDADPHGTNDLDGIEIPY